MPRARVYATNADRQRAYRMRKKLQTIRLVKTTQPRIDQPSFSPSEHYISPLSHDEWAKYYCGHYWETDYLTDISDILWTAYRQLMFLPRGTGKSLRCCALFARHILERREPLVVVTGGPANQRRLWNRIKLILKGPKVKQDYGELFESINNTTREIELKPEYLGIGLDPVLRVVSRRGEIVGSHPAWIHIEDLIQEPFRSDESNEALIDWFEGIVEYCASHEDLKETRITGTGTRKAIGDFYGYVMQKLKYASYVRQAVKLINGRYPEAEDITYLEGGLMEIKLDRGEYETIGCPAWPLNKLLISRLLKPLRFAAEMQNDPLPEGGKYFDPSAIVYWDGNLPGRNCPLFMYCDPAFGKQKTADYCAIVIVAWDGPNQKIYVLEHHLEKNMNFDDIIDRYIELFEKYKRLGFVFHWLGIESNFWQVWAVQQIKKAAMPVTGVDNQKNKHERMQSLRPYFTTGLVYMCKNYPHFEEAFNQYVNYDCTDSDAYRKDDFLDALEGAINPINLYTERTWA